MVRETTEKVGRNAAKVEGLKKEYVHCKVPRSFTSYMGQESEVVVLEDTTKYS